MVVQTQLEDTIIPPSPTRTTTALSNSPVSEVSPPFEVSKSYGIAHNIPPPLSKTITTPIDDVNEAVERLAANAGMWKATSPSKRVELLETIRKACISNAPAFIQAEAKCKGRERELCTLDAVVAATFAQQVEYVLDVVKQRRDGGGGTPVTPPGPVKKREDGKWEACVFPRNKADTRKAAFGGPNQINIWLDEKTTQKDIDIAATKAGLGDIESSPIPGQDESKKELDDNTFVTAVLGAGNFATLMMSDVLHLLFRQNRVCIVKVNPVQQLTGPIFEKMIECLVDYGVVRVVYGGADVGQKIIESDSVDHIHMTGSCATYDTIMWGGVEEREERKQEQNPFITKPLTAELGGVSPFIILPNKYSTKELKQMAWAIAFSMAVNDSFICCASRVVITQKGWDQYDKLMKLVEQWYGKLPRARSWYPGSDNTFTRAQSVANKENLYYSLIGAKTAKTLPYMLLKDVDSESNCTFFNEEFWCPLQCFTTLPSTSVESFAELAAKFCNDKLHGNLSAVVYGKPKYIKSNEGAKALDVLVAGLEYGTIAINTFGLYANTQPSALWGGFPTNSTSNVQSGIGFMGNHMMLPNPIKCVLTRASMEPVLKELPKPFVNSPVVVRGIAHVASNSKNPATMAWRVPVGYVQGAF